MPPRLLKIDPRTKRSVRVVGTSSLALFLIFASLPPLGIAARQDEAADPETAFAKKSDKLLKIVRRAANEDRVRGRFFNGETERLRDVAAIERDVSGRVRVSVAVRLKSRSAEELKRSGFEIGAQIGDVATVETDVERLPELAALSSVRKISAAAVYKPLNDLARKAVQLDNSAGQRIVSQTGRGVIVGIIDTGIDFRHPDFTIPGSNGQRTRIKALLDMTVYGGGTTDPGWNYVLPGGTTPIGRLYTEAEINAALQGGGNVLERDRNGHGTHVAGTAAGNGLAGPNPGLYAGMAPEADLIVVKANRKEDGSDGFRTTDIINAMRFIQQKAMELGEPFVINLSLGGHQGPHDGTNPDERVIDEIVSGGPGRAICVAAGNEGDEDIHASGGVPLGAEIQLQVDAGGDSPRFLELYYAKDDRMTVKVTRPDGVIVGPVPYNPSGFINGAAGDPYIRIYNATDDKGDSDPTNDQNNIFIVFSDSAKNLGSSWTITLRGDDVRSGGQFDAWLGGGRFLTYVDGSKRVSSPGTARGAITVGAFVSRSSVYPIGSAAPFTSPGPTADGRPKPEISAPGYFLYSSKSGDSNFGASNPAPGDSYHAGAAGTSMSTPVVTGVVALLLQANSSLTSGQIKDIIRNTAIRDQFTGSSTWDARFGYGKLNAAAAISAVVAPTPTPTPIPTPSPPPPPYSLPQWEAIDLLPNQLEIRYWELNGVTSIYVKLVFPGYEGRVAWESLARSSNSDFTLDLYIECHINSSVQVTTSTARIYELGKLNPGNYNLIIKGRGGIVLIFPFAVSSTPPPPNPIDDARTFVRWHYVDFLSREPDGPGWDHWTNEITMCADPSNRRPNETEAMCVDRKRENTSGAFFLSLEFQNTGYFVYRFYKGTLGRMPYYEEFMADVRQVAQGIVVDNRLFADQINANKRAFAEQWVTRPEFKARYDAMSNETFVNTLFTNITYNASSDERAALINALNTGAMTRGQVVYQIIDGTTFLPDGTMQFLTSYGQFFYRKEFNNAFVLMQYFGYLRRDPDPAGYNYWLTKLNTYGNFIDAQMVRAFIVSPEYRSRFGAP
ncbi:S8 family serine peptidase [Pyrinomonas methylaliphatogenes]|uniref:Subtilisin-like serine protease n=1 Tax=Pyrinomonas methylaliphatogenes TaxID=454194 RepID=A0A0B6WZV5_9BACT|nr:S8 family serine peptidase [Pyrinomonas methylaliphatogenes]CDM65844.1 subtilisin-like serine protease [Pyrinomonas methylaliphatogenes]